MTRPCRIAISGVPGTGKTALAKELSRRLTIPLIHQGTKELRQTMVGDDPPPFYKMNEVQRIKYQLQLIDYRLGIENQYNEFVADGCAIDMLVWYRMCSWLVPYQMKIQTFMALRQVVQRYDHIFYLPFQIPKIDDDETHLVDPFNLTSADYIYKGVISELLYQDVKIWVIQTPQSRKLIADEDNIQDALDKRVEEVLEVLAKEQKPEGVTQ